MVTGSELPRLGWAAHGFTFDRSEWRPIQNTIGMPIKPHGGLWTAPLLDDGGTPWTRWCEDNDYDHSPGPVVPIRPDPDAAVFVIDTLNDLEEFGRRFPPDGPRPVYRFPMWMPLDWEKAATEVDAVWLTEEGQYRTRHSMPGLYGWDCETVLWLQPRFTEETP
jgi:hypothetical protein